MLANGNGTPQQCLFNLLSIVRGENPYERCKGLPADISDRPSATSFGAITTEAIWNARYYEPRAHIEDVLPVAEKALSGKYRIGIVGTMEEG